MLFLPIIVSLFAIVFALFLLRKINKASSGSKEMIKLSLTIREGVMTFLKRKYKVTGIVTLFLFFILWLFLGLKPSFGFLLGVVVSILVGFIGMIISFRANVKVAEAAKKGLSPALNLALQAGSVTSLLVVSFGLLTISSCWAFTHDLRVLVAFGLGGSLNAVFARLKEGVYTNKTDVETDLFQDYVIILFVPMILGVLTFPQSPQIVLFPLILASIGILALIITIFFVRLGQSKNIMGVLYKGLILSGIVAVIGFWSIIKSLNSGLYSAVFSSFWLAGIYGINLIVLVVISLTGIIVTMNSYGLMIKGAARIIESAGQSSKAQRTIKVLKGQINAIQIAAKSYTIVSIGLVVLVLLLIFVKKIMEHNVKILFPWSAPKILIGLFILGSLFYYLKGPGKDALFLVIRPTWPTSNLFWCQVIKLLSLGLLLIIVP